MAESILKLKVESSEYDSKIKRAAEGLQHYANQCRKAGGTLEFVEKDTLKFVNALGHMETSSTSARGKLNELTKAFTEMSVVYNKLVASLHQVFAHRLTHDSKSYKSYLHLYILQITIKPVVFNVSWQPLF